MKYLFLGEFLLLAQQNTKCHDLAMLAGRLGSSVRGLL